MGFLDSEFDLTDTIYSSQDLSMARGLFERHINRLCPFWLNSPSGHFAALWCAIYPDAACRIIHFAKILNTLGPKLSERSQQILDKKLKDMLGVSSKKGYNERQFDELLRNCISCPCGLFSLIQLNLNRWLMQ